MSGVRLKMVGAHFQPRLLFGNGHNHRFERINIVGKLCNSRHHRRHHNIFRAVLPRLFSGMIQIATAAPQPTDCGRFTVAGRTFFQSIPSTRASNCAWFKRTLVGAGKASTFSR
jgi:hypothetical protein